MNTHNCCKELDKLVRFGIGPVKLLDEMSMVRMLGAKL